MPRYGIVDTGDTSGHPRDRERATEPTYRRSLPGGRDGARGDGKESPQPPSFVVYTEGVLRWLGVEGVTPEVLRRAKRGLQEKEVVRCTLLHGRQCVCFGLLGRVVSLFPMLSFYKSSRS